MISKTCTNCSASFLPKKGPRQKYCSKACWVSHTKNNGLRIPLTGQRGRLFAILLDEGLLPRKEAADRLGITRMQFWQLANRMGVKDDDIEVYIALTDTGKRRALAVVGRGKAGREKKI